MISVDLSVIICTLNRSGLLRKCLESLAQQEAGAFTFETIVVDNGSTDDTKVVTESFRTRINGLRYVLEPLRGLARARQTGFEASVGKYVAYLDDDAIAARCWCSVICETFDQTGQSPADKVAALGGPIEPRFETGRPSWLTHELESLYAIVDMGNELHSFLGSGSPTGANMTFLRTILLENPWDHRLLMCEEINLFARLRSKGFKFLYVPDMKVQHFISAKRLNREWLLRRYFAEGIAHTHLPLGTLHKTRVAIAAFVKLPFLLAFSRFGSEGRRLKYRCKLRFYHGYIAALMGFRDPNSTEYISARRSATF
ncbi:MAG: glycosyltransferase [Terriglobia bacterium]